MTIGFGVLLRDHPLDHLLALGDVAVPVVAAAEVAPRAGIAVVRRERGLLGEHVPARLVVASSSSSHSRCSAPSFVRSGSSAPGQ